MDENNVMVNNEYEETEITTVDPEVTDEVAEVESNFGFKKAASYAGLGAILAAVGYAGFRKMKAVLKAKKKNKSIEVTANPVDTEAVVEKNEASVDAPEA